MHSTLIRHQAYPCGIVLLEYEVQQVSP